MTVTTRGVLSVSILLLNVGLPFLSLDYVEKKPKAKNKK
jgi:hypothetical protein